MGVGPQHPQERPRAPHPHRDPVALEDEGKSGFETAEPGDVLESDDLYALKVILKPGTVRKDWPPKQ